LSLVPIRCPTCGSAAASTSNANEYVCAHCQTRFQIVRPSDGTIVTDVKAHICPSCRRGVQPPRIFRCSECQKVDLCENCVISVPAQGRERFVCKTCLVEKKLGGLCGLCQKFAPTLCVSCGMAACDKHYGDLFARPFEAYTVLFFDCSTCRGRVCVNCAELHHGFLSTDFHCRRCHSKLEKTRSAGKLCESCYLVMFAASDHCPRCGKPL
jgi:hypothetical protein